MRWTQAARQTSAQALRTAEVCGPDRIDAGVKFAGNIPRGDGDKKADHRGETKGNVQPIGVGMPGNPG